MKRSQRVDEIIKTLKARPRNIGALKREYLFIHILQASILKQHKETYPDFGYKGTTSDYEKIANSKLGNHSNDEETVYISTDISSFDSAQYDWLMKIIDVPVWKKACETFEKTIPFWTKDHSRITIKAATNVDVTIVYCWKGIPLLKIRVRGSVPSGHGPKTTDCNTRRNRVFQDYIIDIANIPKFAFDREILGDDFWLHLLKIYCDAWLRAARLVYKMQNDDTFYGLGWVCKAIMVQEGKQARFDFCSKTTVRSVSGPLISRDFSKYFMNGRFYVGSNQNLLSHPHLHKFAVDLCNLEYFANMPLLEELHTRPRILKPRQERQIQRYLMAHTSWENKTNPELRKSVDILSEIQIFFSWKHKKMVPKSDIISLITQFRDSDQVYITNKDLLQCLVGKINMSKQQPSKQKQAPTPKKVEVLGPMETQILRALKSLISRKVSGINILNSRVGVIYGTVQTGITNKGMNKSVKYNQLVQKAQNSKTKLSNDEMEYLQCVLDPSLYTAKIPNPFPVASCLCQSKGTVYLNASATGMLALTLNPFRDNTLLMYVTTALTETSPLAPLSWVNHGIIAPTVGNSVSRRVVGAYLKVECLTPDLSRTGLLTVCYLNFDPYTTVNVNYDSIRDQPLSMTMNLSKRASGRVGYFPIDPSCIVYGPAASGVGQQANQYPTLVALISSAVANAQFAISYRVVYEFIPSGDKTDLLPPTVAAKSTVDPVHLVSHINNFVSKAPSYFDKGLSVASGLASILGTIGTVVSKIA